jgi:hypothetical protein
MVHRHILVFATTLLAAACAGTPREPNRYGHQFEYEYQPPAEVAAADDEACGQRANEAALAESSKVSDRGAILFGAVGAMVQLARIRKKMNDTYAEVFRACLVERGYELSEDDPKRTPTDERAPAEGRPVTSSPGARVPG